jgi:hypothetical protein
MPSSPADSVPADPFCKHARFGAIAVGHSQRTQAIRTQQVTMPTELKKRAKELGISGYSGLTKTKLVDKLRNH